MSPEALRGTWGWGLGSRLTPVRARITNVSNSSCTHKVAPPGERDTDFFCCMKLLKITKVTHASHNKAEVYKEKTSSSPIHTLLSIHPGKSGWTSPLFSPSSSKHQTHRWRIFFFLTLLYLFYFLQYAIILYSVLCNLQSSLNWISWPPSRLVNRWFSLFSSHTL